MSFVKIKSWLAALVTVALVGCGGGGGDAGTPFIGGGGGSSSAANVDVKSSSTTLGDGDSTVTITAIVKDASNVALPGTTVTWATSVGSLTGAAATTDSTGTATATFSSASRSVDAAEITVRSGNASGKTTVNLRGSRTVVLSSSKTQVGTDGDTATLTAIVRDASNVAISGAAVVWSSSAGALSGQTSVTNASGVATATFAPTGVNPATTPTVTVTASSGTSPQAQTLLNISPSTTSIELLTSQPTVGTGGEQVTITAFVKDGNNLAKTGAPVSWSVDSGRISNQQATTNANGIATAVLDAGSNKSNRTAIVTVNSGAARQALSVPVVNTKLAYSGATTLAVGGSMQITLTATDSKSVPIPGVALGLSSSLGNTVPATATTDSAGQAIVTYGAARSGADTLTVTGAGASVVSAITVSGLEDELAFVTPAASSDVLVRQTQQLQLRYRKNGVAQAGATINLAATIGTLSPSSSVTTGADGTATVNISSSFAGVSTISATVAGSASQPVRATLPLNFIATTPSKLVLQVTPSALAPNLAGATTNQAAVVAKVTDADGNPVAKTTVNFSQQADPSGGRLQQASAVTDLNGVATVQYLSGPESTASGAVKLSAAVPGSSASGNAVLTVNQSALFIALGDGNTIGNFNSETYEKKWTVYVTDANGVAVTNVPVTVKVLPNYFAKGDLIWSDTASQWIYNSYRECPNEDGSSNPGRKSATDTSAIWTLTVPPVPPLVTKPIEYNFNGILDPGEDLNGDGTLTPGNVVALTSGVVTTDANGSATITLRYAELYASWIGVRLTATAIVSGTESTTFRDFPLDKLSGDYSVKTVAPAGVNSPFGVDIGSCLNPN